MYLSPEDARSDVILAGAATVFGPVLLSMLLTAPGVPTRGTAGEVVLLLAWLALSALVPFLLARYRQDIPGAFGMGGGGALSGPALLLAVPAAALGATRALLLDGSALTGALGRIGQPLLGSPVVGATAPDVVGAVLAALRVGVLTVGALLLVTFLTVRGRDAFRADERDATELLRTFGAGAIAVAAVAGVLTALGGGTSFATLGLNLLGAAALLLVADRAVPVRAVVTRPAVLTPVVLVVVAHVFAGGGLFRGGLVVGLYTGGLAALTTVVVAVTAERGRRAAVVVPLLLAVHWWPTCLSPLALSSAGC